MTAPGKRRWFRFGLRTMFVVVTFVAVALGWLVWQMQIVRERQAILAELDGVDSSLAHTMKLSSFEENGIPLESLAHLQLSTVRKWLGDDSYVSVGLFSDVDETSILRVERAFLESQLSVYDAAGREVAGLRATRVIAFRDSLYQSIARRQPNIGTIFKTGLIEK